MSTIKPINIINSNINKDNNDIIQCIFELKLTMKKSNDDNNILIFKDITYSKYCNIIKYTDMIPYKMIDSYSLTINIIRFMKETFTINQKFTVDEEDTHIFKNEDMYIEFTQNNEGLVNCCCYLTLLDNSRLFITPPNY